MKPDSITVYARSANHELCDVRIESMRTDCGIVGAPNTTPLFLTTTQATALRDDLTKALAENAEADRPKIAPITPGRYRKGNGTIGVVTHVIGEKAIGYSTYDDAPLMVSAADWTLDGAHGTRWGEYPSMDLVSRIEESPELEIEK